MLALMDLLLNVADAAYVQLVTAMSMRQI